MNVIIPVAGEGVRLKPHTHSLPKSLLSVAGKPILGHIFERLKPLRISKIVMVLGAKSEPIIQFCQKYPYKFNFVKQHKRLGLGHAIYTGTRGLKGAAIVLLGDTIIDYDFKSFCYSRTNILAVKEVSNPRRFGIVEVKDSNVIGAVEKPEFPKSNLAIAGLYYFWAIEKLNRALAYIIRKRIKTRGEYQLTDGLNYLIKRGEEFKIAKIDEWFDCGTAEALLETNRQLLKKTHYYKKRDGVVVIEPLFIPDSATIEESVLGPDLSIGENVTIKGSIIKNSIINNGAYVENSLLSNSIIGQHAVVKGSLRRLNVGDSSIIEFP